MDIRRDKREVYDKNIVFDTTPQGRCGKMASSPAPCLTPAFSNSL